MSARVRRADLACGRRDRRTARRVCPAKTFSATVSCGTSEPSWCTMAMPRRAAACSSMRPRARAVQQHLAGIRLVDAADDLAQGRLAGAVLAQQGVDLAAPDIRGHVPQGLDARELLPAAADLQAERLVAVTPGPGRRRRHVWPRPSCVVTGVGRHDRAPPAGARRPSSSLPVPPPRKPHQWRNSAAGYADILTRSTLWSTGVPVPWGAPRRPGSNGRLAPVHA